MRPERTEVHLAEPFEGVVIARRVGIFKHGGKMSTGEYLKKFGFTNSDTEDIGVLATAERILYRGTFCSSDRCGGRNYRNGKLIHVGERYLFKCPDCGGSQIYHLPVSTAQVKLLQQRRSVKTIASTEVV